MADAGQESPTPSIPALSLRNVTRVPGLTETAAGEKPLAVMRIVKVLAGGVVVSLVVGPGGGNSTGFAAGRFDVGGRVGGGVLLAGGTFLGGRSAGFAGGTFAGGRWPLDGISFVVGASAGRRIMSTPAPKMIMTPTRARAVRVDMVYGYYVE
ncbi:MAG: hypothetical protein Q8R39_04130 [bacterium]|nr:hypothetical protein [bacterium]MDZ4284688.1 hypothetical protein [Patescibacteria group bacterium]